MKNEIETKHTADHWIDRKVSQFDESNQDCKNRSHSSGHPAQYDFQEDRLRLVDSPDDRNNTGDHVQRTDRASNEGTKKRSSSPDRIDRVAADCDPGCQNERNLLGRWIDGKLDSDPYGALIGFLLGTTAAITNLIRSVNRLQERAEKRDAKSDTD